MFKFSASVMLFCLLFSGQVFGQQYDKGIYRWKIKEGELTLVAAKMNRQDVVAGIFTKFFFYLDVANDGTYEVPFLKTHDLGGDYEDSVLAFDDGDTVWSDAEVVQKKGQLFVYYGYGNRKLKYKSGPIVVKIYKLFEGGVSEWSYGFKVEKILQYPVGKQLTVLQAIKEAEAEK